MNLPNDNSLPSEFEAGFQPRTLRSGGVVGVNARHNFQGPGQVPDVIDHNGHHATPTPQWSVVLILRAGMVVLSSASVAR